MNEQDYPKDSLVAALHQFGIEVEASDEKVVRTAMDYAIEIEGESLFKLTQGGQVIAPFAEIEELCQFIKMDMELNAES